MRRTIIFGLITLLFIKCSNKEVVTTTNPTQNTKIVATDDTYQVVEDTENVLPNILSNDTYTGTSVQVTFEKLVSNNGKITENRDGTYTYTPNKAYVGDDIFTYTICDRASIKNCDTATVTITVNDQGNPKAVNDAYSTTKNTAFIIKDYLQNDELIDDATVGEIINTGTSGTVVLANDGNISYTPKQDFLGKDTFSYTICDDDATKTCATATVTITILEPITFTIPTELAAYYNGVTFSTDKDRNYEALKTLTVQKHTTILSYGQRHNFLYNADKDLANTANVLLMYTGESRDKREYTSGSNSHPTQTFNTEHIYPQSKLASTNAVSDLHHLRSCDAAINSKRSNFPFTDGAGAAELDGSKWYPGDDWRGDVARMIFYLNVRYGETFEKVGSLDLFLKWNLEDPVSDFEIERNKVITAAQGNRNPFIDNPYLVTITWGGNNAENKW